MSTEAVPLPVDLNGGHDSKYDPPPFGLVGLTEQEVIDRRQQGLGNDFPVRSSRTYGEILRGNLLTFFNLVLFGVSLALLLLGSPRDAFLTASVALLNVLVATVQEVRAKIKLDHISLLTRPRAAVIRGGKIMTVDPQELVVGDVQLVEPGDQIVADGHIVGQGHMDVDESLLTGESDPVHKKSGDKVLSGSFCLRGRAAYEADDVGASSFANKLTEGARHFTKEYTPLQRDVDLIIRVLLMVVIFFGLFIALNYFMNENMSLLESVQSAAVVFGLAPSSLFLTIVVAYALGALRIADKGALVQQANSVESLCHVTVLCLDKTGTLTANEITLNELLPLPGADLSEDDLRRTLGGFARSVSVENRTTEAIARGCPGDRAPFTGEVSFSSDHQWSALSFDDRFVPGTHILGAPERLLPNLEPKLDIDDRLEALTSSGQRVLLYAHTDRTPSLMDENDNPQMPASLKPLALLSFQDQIREEAPETLDRFMTAGIRLKIISGDNPRTVSALAQQAGLKAQAKSLKAVSGADLQEMDEAHFAQIANEADIFGRITPEQKQRLVQTLRNQGHYVAMTGDGVNDVLAMKQANLGIAMQNGSQATRSVSDIVLLNDSFAALPQAFIEGQRILNGMEDIFRLYMTRIFSLVLLIASIAMLAAGFPFTPSQSSIISILTLSIPAFALALWARPGPVRRASMTRRLVHFILPASVTMGAAGLAIFLFFVVSTGDREYAQLALTYAMIIMGLILIVFVEPPTESWAGGDVYSGDWRPTILALALFLVFVVAFSTPVVRDFYGLVPLKQTLDYLVVAGVIVLWVLVLRTIWRARLIDRYLNVKLNPGT